MKPWILLMCAVLAVAAMGWMPFTATDVADLRPVETIRFTSDGGTVRVETDLGDVGIGTDPESAFRDLQKTTPGNVFLETADYLIIDRASESYLIPLNDYLRPGCGVCVEDREIDVTDVSEYLRDHESPVSLQDCRVTEQDLPVLSVRGGRYYLEP